MLQACDEQRDLVAVRRLMQRRTRGVKGQTSLAHSARVIPRRAIS